MHREELPLVSVVMPVYNTARFLKPAIDSVLNQTYRNIELLILDDGSTDDSQRILQEYEKQDSRIRIFLNEGNRGVAQVRNQGIRAARGTWIALLDSDDIWAPEKLEKQMQLLLEKKAAIAYCSVDFIDDQGQRTKSFLVPSSTDYKRMLDCNYFICSTVVVKAGLLKEHPFTTDYYHEDYVLWLELLKLNVKAVGEPEVLACYRRSAGSKSSNKLNAARHRWIIYRKACGMNLVQSCRAFIKYALSGFVKHYT